MIYNPGQAQLDGGEAQELDSTPAASTPAASTEPTPSNTSDSSNDRGGGRTSMVPPIRMGDSNNDRGGGRSMYTPSSSTTTASSAPAAAPAAPTTGSGTLPGDEYALRANAAAARARNDASNTMGRTTADVYAKQYGAKATPAPAARSAAPQTPRTSTQTPPRQRPAAGNGGGVGPASPGYASQLNEQYHAIPNAKASPGYASQLNEQYHAVPNTTGAMDSQRNAQYHAVPNMTGAIDSQRNEQYHVVPGRARGVVVPNKPTSHATAQPTPASTPSAFPSPRSTAKATPGAGTVLAPAIPKITGW